MKTVELTKACHTKDNKVPWCNGSGASIVKYDLSTTNNSKALYLMTC